MRSFHNLPIKWKLTLVMVLASVIAAALLGSALFFAGLVRLRHLAVRETAGLAGIIGRDCAGALVAGDANAARKQLGDLAAWTIIEEACLFTADGREFARYTRRDLTPRPLPPVRGSAECFAGDHLELYRQIEHGGKPVGTIHLRADTRTNWARIKSFVGVSVVATAILALVVLALASWLERFIFSSMRELVRVARAVTERKDFTLRAAKLGGDETGVLTDAFNQMLGIIQERDSDSRASQSRLEKGVQERTRQLEDSNARLKTEMIGRTQAERALAQLNAGLETRVQQRTAELSAEITERKQAEEALRESEDRYHSLFAASLDAVLLTVPDGRILAANAAACRMFGRSEEELIRLGRSGVVDVSDPRLPPALEERERTGRFVGELTFLRSDGSKFSGAISSAVFRNQEGELRTSMAIRDITESKQVAEELGRTAKQLQALSRSLVDAQETERRRIAQELHDDIGQLLTLLKLLLDTAADGSLELARERLRDASRRAHELIAAVRNISLDLRPSMLDDVGLLPALLWLGDRFADRTQVHIEHSGVEGRRFSPEVEIAVYRIAQESLTNIVRHAGRSQAVIRLRADAEMLQVEVEDDGCGFDAAAVLAKGRSIGLHGMRERATALGGELRIESAPGEGTRVVARLPLGKVTGDE